MFKLESHSLGDLLTHSVVKLFVIGYYIFTSITRLTISFKWQKLSFLLLWRLKSRCQLSQSSQRLLFWTCKWTNLSCVFSRSFLPVSLSGSFFIQARVWLHFINYNFEDTISKQVIPWRISLRLHPINPADMYKSSCSHENTNITDFGGLLRWWWNDQIRTKRVRFCQSYSSQLPSHCCLYDSILKCYFGIELFTYCFIEISPQFWGAYASHFIL